MVVAEFGEDTANTVASLRTLGAEHPAKMQGVSNCCDGPTNHQTLRPMSGWG